MNTLKSGTTIVVLLGVLYGVYIVLSKPDRLRELKLPGVPSAGSSAQSDPGPQIDFGGAAPAEPHLAVESGAPPGLAFENTSPASPAPPSVAHAGVEVSPAATAPAPSAPESGSSYGGANPGSSYGQSVAGMSAPGPSAYGSTASAESPSANGSGYGVGSRYSVTSGVSESLTDNSPPSAYGSSAGSIQRTSVQEPLNGYGAPPVQNSYGTSASTSSANAMANLSDTSPEVRSDALAEYSLRQMWSEAERLVAENKLKEALALLSSHYSHPGMPAEQRATMVPWLDALAARVIYSKAHLLEMPYEVRAKETLFDIQERFNVPWQLLQNINSDVVKDPQIVVVGTPLKVVKGPFRADVELSRGEVTVYLNELYAGRFPFTMGSEPVKPGAYKVVDKRLDRVYYGADGRTIPAGDPTNPYGGVWIDLGKEVSIHGSPGQAAASEQLGCISLSPQDAKDLYGILSLSSEVVVR